MARTLIATAAAAFALAALAATPALAQQRITVGQTVQGSLTTSDPALSDGSHYDCWLFDAPGGTLTITVESSAFDTVLMASPGAGCGDGDENTVRQNDDGPGMGTNSQIVFNNARGPYWVVVNSYGAGQTGAYSLRVTAGGAPSAAPAKPSSGGGQPAPAARNGAGQRPAAPDARYTWDVICKAADTVALIGAIEGMSDNDLSAWMTLSGRFQEAASASAAAIGKTEQQLTDDVVEYAAAWIMDEDLMRDVPPGDMRSMCEQALR